MARPSIIDAHIHLWDLKRLRYDWLMAPFSDDGPNGNVESIAHTYLLSDYLADAASWTIGGAVHVEAGAAAHQALDETRFVQAIADKAPFPLVHVAYAPLQEPDAARRLAAHATYSCVRGIRQILNWHPDPKKTYTAKNLLGTTEFEAGFRLLSRHGLSFDLQIYPGQMKAAAALAARHAETTLILNHAGMPTDRDPEGIQLWRDGMKALASCPNVSVKLSGFGIVDPNWTIESIRPFMCQTIDLFGASRCMIASDVPTDKLHAGFDRILDAYVECLKDLSPSERTQLFEVTARRTYRL